MVKGSAMLYFYICIFLKVLGVSGPTAVQQTPIL